MRAYALAAAFGAATGPFPRHSSSWFSASSIRGKFGRVMELYPTRPIRSSRSVLAKCHLIRVVVIAW